MQVFISDLHLTDGTSGQTINSGAFEVFRDNLKNLVHAVKAKSTVTELKIVLLGDIFDVIRSTKWLEKKTRPWSDTAPELENQETVVGKIIEGILSNSENMKSLGCFKELREFSGEMNIGFQLQYVIGNHDWLINRYPGCRKVIAEALGMPTTDTAPPFPSSIFDPAYRTFARHGDIYDELNYMGARDKSSIGDVIVIELLNRFPREVEKELNELVEEEKITAFQKDEIVNNLKELDNIRPLIDAPSWILMVSNRIRNEHARQVIEKAWKRCVDDFFKVPFIKEMNIPFWPDTIDKLKIALQLSSHTSKWVLEKVAELKSRYFPSHPERDYHKKAFAESMVRSGEANFVLYGHTHEHLIIPMDQTPLYNGDVQNKLYFNTGTWRQIWNKVAFDTVNREFIGWKVLTYIAFYNDDENNKYSFEVWNGALGRGKVK